MKAVILGCENTHADSFLKLVEKNAKFADLEIVGIYSDDAAAAQRLHKQFGVYVAKSYDEFVGKVDGVIITARHGDNHYKYAKPYIESGIPMFIDKPITCTEEDAQAFMDELKAHQIPVCGGSVCVLAEHVQMLKKQMQDCPLGKVIGGHLRAPVNMKNEYGDFLFYSQHLVQVAMELFGNYPDSVQMFPKGPNHTCIVHYPEYDVTLNFVEGPGYYYAGVHYQKGYVGDQYNCTTLFVQELEEFCDLVRGGAQHQSYEDFFAPVYVMNAMQRSLESGKLETVNRCK